MACCRISPVAQPQPVPRPARWAAGGAKKLQTCARVGQLRGRTGEGVSATARRAKISRLTARPSRCTELAHGGIYQEARLVPTSDK